MGNLMRGDAVDELREDDGVSKVVQLLDIVLVIITRLTSHKIKGGGVFFIYFLVLCWFS